MPFMCAELKKKYTCWSSNGNVNNLLRIPFASKSKRFASDGGMQFNIAWPHNCSHLQILLSDSLD